MSQRVGFRSSVERVFLLYFCVVVINQLYSSNKFDSSIKNKKQNTETVSNTGRNKHTQREKSVVAL